MSAIPFFHRTCHFGLSSLPSQGAPPLGLLVITLVAAALLFPTLVHAATTPAHEAAEVGDIKRLKALLDKDPDLINAKDDSGIQPLHMAAWEGQDEAVTLNIAARDSGDWTALHFAARDGHTATCRLLLERGADRSARNDVSRTPLRTARTDEVRDVLLNFHPVRPGVEPFMASVLAGDAKEVGLQLDKNPKWLDAKDASGSTATMVAAKENHIAVLKLLIERGADVKATPPDGFQSALYLASSGGHVEAVELLLEHHAQLHPTSLEQSQPSMLATPLSAAANTISKNARWDSMLAALQGGPEAIIGEVGDQPFGDYTKDLLVHQPEATRAAKRKIAKLLLDAGADPNRGSGVNPIGEAAGSGETEIVRLLLKRGADPNGNLGTGTGTPIAAAVMCHAPAELLRLLLAAGADPLLKGKFGNVSSMSAMNTAVLHDNVEAFELMLTELKADKLAKPKHFEVLVSALPNPGWLKKTLAKGFDFRATNTQEMTALHFAAHRDMPESVRLLLDAGADVGAKDHMGFTPLHNAAKKGREETVKLLLERRANLESRTTDRRTPLSVGCTGGGNVETIRLLTKAGAKLEARDSLGWTPLMTAAGLGRLQMVAHLLEAGADVNATNAMVSVLGAAAAGGGHLLGKTSQKGFKASQGGSDDDYLRIAHLLIEHDADIEQSGDGELKGSTPLETALKFGSRAMVDLLLKKGTDIKAKNAMQLDRTPLWAAINGGRDEMLELVIALGVNVNAPDTNKLTPLHFAAGPPDQAKMVETLLKNGANINAQQGVGATPLFHAVYHKASKSVRVLLKHGADKNIAGQGDMTPVDLARALKNREMVRLLTAP